MRPDVVLSVPRSLSRGERIGPGTAENERQACTAERFADKEAPESRVTGHG